jgi:alpha/beta superfamily hydrolase
MKQRKVTFTNAAGIELAGLLDLPEDEQPLAWALFAHCFTCSKNIKASASISRALVSQRIAVLRFDFRDSAKAPAISPPSEPAPA